MYYVRVRNSFGQRLLFHFTRFDMAMRAARLALTNSGYTATIQHPAFWLREVTS